ncbi:hypothetical protein LCGC14_0997650 [marine sediment metagenome]|uniref:Uncharacterized protein n=1 Tax=marine sediment metagenome TaxID=412755 RepID=A0A0F9NQI8_9ZZZZ|nr:hypothetical protein [Methylophaga sp.]
MSTINSIGIASSLITNNQTTATQQANAVSNSTTAAISTDSASTQDKVEISTRAQKIQKLNEEFFSKGMDSFAVTQGFIQRLADYGLITADEATKLGASAETSESGDASTVGELSTFIDSFSESLKKTDPNDTLIDILQQAKTVLDNFNSPTQSSQNINISQVSGQLQNYIDTSGEKLSATDKQSINQLVSALDVASILTPGKNTTSQINSYLAIKNM